MVRTALLATLFVACRGYLPSRGLIVRRHAVNKPRQTRPALMEAADPAPPEVPPEIIEAEANATPNRKFREWTSGVGVAISALSAALTIASLSGLLEGGEDVYLFGSPKLTLLTDGIIGWTSVWAYQEEQRTKQENIARIWEQVQQRAADGKRKKANRSQRRAKKVEVSAALRGEVPIIDSSIADSPTGPSPPPEPPSPATTPEPSSPPPGLGGLLSFFAEANAIGRSQAVWLNKQLEDAGVLPPINPAGGTEQASPEPDAAARPATASAEVRSGMTSTPEPGTPGFDKGQKSKRRKKGRLRG